MSRTHFQLAIRKGWVFGAVTLALILAAIEIGWRVSDWRKEARAAEKEAFAQTFEMRLAGGRRISARPGQLALVHAPFIVYRSGRGELTGEARLDARGFRGPGFEARKPPGVTRVILTGGSVAFGWSVRVADTISVRLEARLNERAAGLRRYEVVNAGVIGFVAAQEMVLYATELFEYDADVLVALNGWNDLERARVAPPDRPLQPGLFAALDETADRAFDPLERVLGWSAAFRGVKRKIARARDARDAETRRRPGGAAAIHPDAIPHYARSVRFLARAARASGTRPILCLQPELFSKSPHSPKEADIAKRHSEHAIFKDNYAHFADAARAAAAAEGARFVDGRKAFDGLAETMFLDAVHPTAAGNDLLAAHSVPAVEAAAADEAAASAPAPAPAPPH